MCAYRAEEEIEHHLVFACPRFDGIRADFLGDKGSWEELDKADWRKVGEWDDAWYSRQ